jgi:hypothetical protein
MAGLPRIVGAVGSKLQRITLNLIVAGIEAMSGVTDRSRDLLIRSGQYEPGPSGRRRANFPLGIPRECRWL